MYIIANNSLGMVICKPTFLYMNAIGKSRLAALTAHYTAHGTTTRDFLYKGRNNKAVTKEESMKIVSFLHNVAEVHSLSLPGRVPGN